MGYKIDEIAGFQTEDRKKYFRVGDRYFRVSHRVLKQVEIFSFAKISKKQFEKQFLTGNPIVESLKFLNDYQPLDSQWELFISNLFGVENEYISLVDYLEVFNESRFFGLYRPYMKLSYSFEVNLNEFTLNSTKKFYYHPKYMTAYRRDLFEFLKKLFKHTKREKNPVEKVEIIIDEGFNEIGPLQVYISGTNLTFLLAPYQLSNDEKEKL